jgi:hypothetical protein
MHATQSGSKPTALQSAAAQNTHPRDSCNQQRNAGVSPAGPVASRRRALAMLVPFPHTPIPTANAANDRAIGNSLENKAETRGTLVALRRGQWLISTVPK